MTTYLWSVNDEIIEQDIRTADIVGACVEANHAIGDGAIGDLAEHLLIGV